MSPSNKEFYESILRIRQFEERVLEMFPQGLFYGTTHTYIGQEANAVGVLSWLEEGDLVVSNHRCHGHFLAYGGSMEALAAELMGRSSGVCGGRGGSQHLQWRNFYANGILGGTIPLATGMAFALQRQSPGKIVFAFMGDGTLGEGVVYESLNMASLWGLPIYFVLENNRYAQSTPIELNLAGDIEQRFTAFDIPVQRLDSTDVQQIREAAHSPIEDLRSGHGPTALILDTYRFAPHSKGDDVRDPEEIAKYQRRDPIPISAERLGKDAREAIAAAVQKEIDAAMKAAQEAPMAVADQITPALGPSA